MRLVPLSDVRKSWFHVPVEISPAPLHTIAFDLLYSLRYLWTEAFDEGTRHSTETCPSRNFLSSPQLASLRSKQRWCHPPKKKQSDTTTASVLSIGGGLRSSDKLWKRVNSYVISTLSIIGRCCRCSSGKFHQISRSCIRQPFVINAPDQSLCGQRYDDMLFQTNSTGFLGYRVWCNKPCRAIIHSWMYLALKIKKMALGEDITSRNQYKVRLGIQHGQDEEEMEWKRSLIISWITDS